MNKHNQEGAVNALVLPFIITVVLLVAALGFGFWAYGGYTDYKNNSDQKVAVAVKAAQDATSVQKDKEAAEAAKSPYKTYKSPDEFGSISLTYPKTWSGYVNASTQASPPLDAYFNPDVVPSVSDQGSTFALRMQVINQSYSDTLAAFNDQEGVTVSPYALPKVPKAVGAKITGQIESEKQGIMVILPDRDKTLQVYTESAAFTNDFNNIILPNLTFAP